MSTKNNSFDQEMFNIASLSYNHFNSLIDAVLWIKMAFAKNNAIYGFISESAKERICSACSQCLDHHAKEPKLPNIYAGSKFILCHSIDRLILETDSQIRPEDLNCHQSVNGVINSAFEMVVYQELEKILQACDYFKNTLQNQVEKFKDVDKLGRLGLKDHFPTTLDCQFNGYLQGIERLEKQIRIQQASWNSVSLGADEIGRPLELPEKYWTDITEVLSSLSGHKLCHYNGYMDAIANSDKLVITHAHIQALSNLIWKIARDLRLMCSGPRGGIQEITLPAVAPGSSIMPGKLNPVIAEMVFNTVDQVDANHSGLNLALKSGWLEGGSNSFVPIRSFINSTDLLSRTMMCFAQRCIEGIDVNNEQCTALAKKSLAVTVIIEALIGKEKTQSLIDQATKTNSSLESVFRKAQALPEAVCDELFDLNTLKSPEKLKIEIEKALRYF